MSYETITLSITGQVATLTLNQPERLNALSVKMATEISAALDALGDARALILMGAGRGFCAGADLTQIATGGAAQGEASYAVLTEHFNPLIHRIAALPIPTIAAVQGAAAGIGCSLALACNFVIAGNSAYFLQAFVNIGLVADGGVSWMLPRLVGLARATEMLLLGERIPADKAQHWGLIYKAVVDETLPYETETLARRLADGPTATLALTRGNLAAALTSDFATTLQTEAEAQRVAAGSVDAIEGATAFLQKRKPVFKGK